MGDEGAASGDASAGVVGQTSREFDGAAKEIDLPGIGAVTHRAYAGECDALAGVGADFAARQIAQFSGDASISMNEAAAVVADDSGDN